MFSAQEELFPFFFNFPNKQTLACGSVSVVFLLELSCSLKMTPADSVIIFFKGRLHESLQFLVVVMNPSHFRTTQL